MKLTVIHGSPRKGNTYHAAQLFLHSMKQCEATEVREFFLPNDLPEFCRGCCACVLHGEEHCPHFRYSKPILDSMLESDALIFTTPVYVMSASGGMKNFLDHFPFLFMVHRPRPEFFHKKVFIISTTVGAGLKSAMKPIARCLKYWGINKVYQTGFRMFALEWGDMPEKRQKKYACRLDRSAEKFWRAVRKGDSTPYVFSRFFFFLCRVMYKRHTAASLDRQYWEAHGWLGGKTPFHNPVSTPHPKNS
ncbi:MAG: flavodoxin family protein [Oscillospiraceae bacterium]|nr:flavodoxin family protein [Oscillospiraceae bacterium]